MPPSTRSRARRMKVAAAFSTPFMPPPGIAKLPFGPISQVESIWALPPTCRLKWLSSEVKRKPSFQFASREIRRFDPAAAVGHGSIRSEGVSGVTKRGRSRRCSGCPGVSPLAGGEGGDESALFSGTVYDARTTGVPRVARASCFRRIGIGTGRHSLFGHAADLESGLLAIWAVAVGGPTRPARIANTEKSQRLRMADLRRGY